MSMHHLKQKAMGVQSRLGNNEYESCDFSLSRTTFRPPMTFWQLVTFIHCPLSGSLPIAYVHTFTVLVRYYCSAVSHVLCFFLCCSEFADQQQTHDLLDVIDF
jgi:hypothetical protein